MRRTHCTSSILILGVVTCSGCALPVRSATAPLAGPSQMVATSDVEPAGTGPPLPPVDQPKRTARPRGAGGATRRSSGRAKSSWSTATLGQPGKPPERVVASRGPAPSDTRVDGAIRRMGHTSTPSRSAVVQARSDEEDDEKNGDEDRGIDEEEDDEDVSAQGMGVHVVSAPGFADDVRLSQGIDDLVGAARGRRRGQMGAMDGDEDEDREDTNLDRPRAERRGEGGGPTRAAEEEDEEEEAEDFKSDLLMKALGLEGAPIGVYGWLQGNFTGNPANPPDHNNFGVVPNSIANRFIFQQLYLVVEKLVEPEEAFDWGFRVDNLFGTDWQQYHVVGFLDNAFAPNHVGYSLLQAYGEVHLPVLTPGGVDVKAGQFFSLPGYEDVAAPGRPLNSTSYMFAFSQPFTNLGVMSVWHVTDQINLYNGVVNGASRWFNRTYRLGYSGAVSWDSGEGDTSLTFTFNYGPNQFPRYFPADYNFIQLPNGVVAPPFLARRRNLSYDANESALFTTILIHEWTEEFTTIVEADQGFETNIPDLGPGGTFQTGAWYGLGGWFLYAFTDKLTGVYRAEWFRDKNGSRTGFNDTYYEQTLGAIYKPITWFWVRPEIRFDLAAGAPVYDDGTKKHQLTLGFDAIFLF